MLVVLIALYAIGTLVLIDRFPDSYPWSELLINYQGGFVRRGLLGELAWQLRFVIPPQYFLAGVIGLAYVGVAVGLVVAIFRRPDLAGILFIVCPATFLLQVYDFEAFARKDILIIAGFGISALILSRPISAVPALIALMAIYLPLGLIHELALFYFPAVVFLLLATRGRHLDATKQLAMLVVSAVYVVVCMAVVSHFHGDAAMVPRIIASWQDVAPGAYMHLGALLFLPYDFGQGLGVLGWLLLGPGVIPGYIIGFALSLVPVVMRFSGANWRQMRGEPVVLLAGLGGVFCALLSFAVAGDWGRMIQLFVMQAFIVALVIAPPTSARGEERSFSMAVALALLVVLYSSAWRIRHASPLNPALYPGTLFLLINPEVEYGMGEVQVAPID